ncbi:MAG: HD domain-containing phosphohydrolase [Nitrospirota bacterium]
MKEEAGGLIAEIKQKIRLLNGIAAFVVVTLLAVIFRYLFKPASEVLHFLPDISITLILLIIVILVFIGFYLWAVVSKKVIRSIEDYKNRLDHILAVTRDLREEIYGDILLEKVMDSSLALTQSDSGAILLVEDGALSFKTAKGARVESLPRTIPPGKGVAGWVAGNAKPVRSGDVQGDARFDPEIDMLIDSNTRSVLCVPLLMKTGVIGVVELFNKKEGFYTEKDEEMIAYLADQAAISLVRAKFFEDQKNYEIHLTDILLEAMDFHVPEKIGHSKRVAKYSNIIARAINMPEEEKKRLYFASLLHDVGFLKIKSEHCFLKEYFVKHPVIGYEMIKPISFYADIAPIILHHHERYDGTGYPGRLMGDDIPIGARIIAIADAFDAMVSTVSYKAPTSFESALDELKRNAGSQFDFWLVEQFLETISPEHLS